MNTTHGLHRHHTTSAMLAGMGKVPVSLRDGRRPRRPEAYRPLADLVAMPSRPEAAAVETAVVQPDCRIRMARTLEGLGLDHHDVVVFTIEPDRVVLSAGTEEDAGSARALRVGTRGQVTLTPALRHALDASPGDSVTVVRPQGAEEAWPVGGGTVAAGVSAVAGASPAGLDLAHHLPTLTARGAYLLMALATRLSPDQLERLASCPPERLDHLLSATDDELATDGSTP